VYVLPIVTNEVGCIPSVVMSCSQSLMNPMISDPHRESLIASWCFLSNRSLALVNTGWCRWVFTQKARQWERSNSFRIQLLMLWFHIITASFYCSVEKIELVFFNLVLDNW